MKRFQSGLKAILAKLTEIETEMRGIGYWAENPPDLQAAAARGEIQTYLDAPSFELRLQVLFLPNAREAATTDELPAESQVGMMTQRQYDDHACVPDAQPLLRLLHEVDRFVENCARRKKTRYGPSHA